MNLFDLPRGIPGTPETQGNKPRALWRDPQTLSPNWLYEDGKVFLGASGDQAIGVKDNRHLLTIAGSRAGKGVSAIVPNLFVYPGSVLVLDPKGENASLTARRRKDSLGQEVFVFDPFKVADVPEDMRSGFNPLSLLDPQSPNFIDDCDSIADALVVATTGKQNDFWNTTARLILRGFIAWVAASPETEQRDLIEVKRLLLLPLTTDTPEEESLAKTFAVMSVNDHIAYGVPAEAANSLASMNDRERSSVIATIQQNIGFLSSPPVAQALTQAEYAPDLKRWKFDQSSIYLCLPAGRLHQHFRFFRLFINLLLGAVESDKQEPEIPALMILDEMHVLGHMSMLETAAGLFAGYGVRIWSIWQDISQLKQLYQARWETFVGNASVLQFFGLNDMGTLNWVSQRLGSSTTLSINTGENSFERAAQGFKAESYTVQPNPLLTPDELAYFFSRESNNQLIIFPGSDPIFLKRIPYWNDYFKE